MFFHAFKTRIKIIFSTKFDAFWLIIFPVILATLFYIAFSHITAEKFNEINLIVCNTSESDQFYKVLKDTQMFELSIDEYENAIELLKDGKVTGVVTTENDTLKLYVGQNGIDQSISKFVLDTYLQTTQAVTDIVTQNPMALSNGFIETIGNQESFVEEVPLNEEGNYDIVSVFFFTIFGMAAMMGSTNMINVVETLQANQSPLAARVCSSPIRKSIVFAANMLGVLITTFISNVLCFIYIKYFLSIDMGNHTLAIILLLLLGSATCVAIGGFVCIAVKKSANFKNGLIVGVSLGFSAMSGMMSTHIKYYLDRYVPFIQKINPVNLITDGLYGLLFYGVSERFYENVIILLIMTVVFTVATFTIARGQKYASI